MGRIWRYLWPLPLTLVGLMLALAVRLCGGEWVFRAGVLETYGPAARLMLRLHPVKGVIAIALGHMVIARDDICLAQTPTPTNANMCDSSSAGACYFRCCMARKRPIAGCGANTPMPTIVLSGPPMRRRL